ncbi:hypothetical protein Tco_0548159 [Tanacetum coccineum]
MKLVEFAIRELEDGIVPHMLVERRFSLLRRVSTNLLHGEELASPRSNSMSLVNDFSYLLRANSLPKKLYGLSMLPCRTARKIEEVNNFQQKPVETLFQAWECFKELLMKCPQHYLTEMQEMAEYSQKWHNGTSRGRSTETFDGLAAIQAQLNNLGREIRKVNEKVYAAQVGCEQCKRHHDTKDCPLKEEGKTLEEAYYT